MINTTAILTAWTRIGWNEPSKTGYTSILDTDNKTSTSGLKFDALHSLANFVMVKDTYPDSGASSAVLNALLKAWQQNAILEATRDVFRENDNMEMDVLLNDSIDLTKTIANSSLFVGWKIVIPKGYVLTINSVETLFDTSGSLTLYVFNESAQTNVTTKAITTVGNTATVTSWAQSLYGISTTYKSNVYYIGYFQDTKQAIQRNYYDLDSICRFTPIQATPNGVTLPPYAGVSQTGNTFGLNLDYTIRKDFTPDYLNNVDLFDRAIGMSVICKLLEQIHFTQRINQSERSAKEGLGKLSALAYLDLNGTAEDNPEIPYKRGLLREYQDEILNIRNLLYKKNSLKVITIK